MGTYGTATGLVMVIPAAGEPGKLLGLTDGELEAYFDSDGQIKCAGGKNVLNRYGILLDALDHSMNSQTIMWVDDPLSNPGVQTCYLRLGTQADLGAVTSNYIQADGASLDITSNQSGVDLTLNSQRYIVLSASGGQVQLLYSARITNVADATAATDALNRQTGDARYGVSGSPNVLYVDPKGTGTYTTLSAALTAAAALTPSTTNEVLIVVSGEVAETAAITALSHVHVLFLAGASVTVTSNSTLNAVNFTSLTNTTWAAVDSTRPHIIRAGTVGAAVHDVVLTACDSTVRLVGIYVQNGATGFGGCYGIYILTASAPTLTNCTGIGGAGDATCYGIYLATASAPTLTNCTGIGGAGGATCMGLIVGAGCNAILTNCTGIGGAGGAACHGIYVSGNGSTLTDCTGIGGAGGITSYGIYTLNSANPTLTNCTGIGGGARQIRASADIAASARQDDSYQPSAAFPYRVVGCYIDVTAGAAAGVTLTLRDATGGAGNALSAAVAVTTTGAKYVPLTGWRTIAAGDYFYGRLSAADATLAYTIYYVYTVEYATCYGLYDDSNARHTYQNCDFVSNGASAAVYVTNNGDNLSVFDGGTARSGMNSGTRPVAFACQSAWVGNVTGMVLDGGVTNLTPIDMYDLVNRRSGINEAAPDRTLHVTDSDAATNAVTYAERLTHLTSGTAAAGFGTGTEYELENASGTNRVAGALEVVYTDATDATEDAVTKLKTIVAGTLTENLQVGSNTQVGTPGTNYTQFDSTGHQTMVGTAKPWDDLRVEPVARTTGTNAPTFEKWYDDAAGTSRGVYLYSFDDASAGSEKEIFFTMQMPHSWDGGSIEMHVHWIGSQSDTTAAPRWALEYNWKEVGADFGDTIIVYSDGSNYTFAGTEADITANRHYISKFVALAPGATADAISSVLIGRLFRNSSDAGDTYNVASNKCGLLYIDAHYQINSIGSTDEYAK